MQSILTMHELVKWFSMVYLCVFEATVVNRIETIGSTLCMILSKRIALQIILSPDNKQQSQGLISLALAVYTVSINQRNGPGGLTRH